MNRRIRSRLNRQLPACLYVVFLQAFLSCDTKSAEAPEPGKDRQDRVASTFAEANYLKVDRITSGPVFADAQTGEDVFYRVVEIPEEEQLFVYIEKVSIGEEGGNYRLANRYRLKEESLNIFKSGFYSLDSLSFRDSVTVVGKFNDKRLAVDLRDRRVLQQ